ncbi:MAG: hypothetical protein OEL89_04190, partial [Candidatus Peregrinibacteria bacterium]|nr:hypothetical protein [Candidatus Peregrinibacteria bacterium]
MKYKFLGFVSLALSLLSLNSSLAATGDFTPQTGLRATGIEHECDPSNANCYPTGLSYIDYNLYTDNAAASQLRLQGFDSTSSYADEREFTTVGDVANLEANGFLHTLNGINVNDELAVQ